MPLTFTEQTSAEALERHIPGRLLANSGGLACHDVLIQIFSRPRLQEILLVPVLAEPLIVWIVSGRATVEEREINGAWTKNQVEVGDFFLSSSPLPYELRWKAEGPDPFEVMHLYLGVPMIERAAKEMSGKSQDHVAFQEVSGKKDLILSQLMDRLRNEMTERRGPSVLFVTGIVQSLAVHLVRHYRDEHAVQAARGALPAIRLRRVIDLMEAHLSERFVLQRLAQETAMSDFHFSRLFKRATGLAPSQYFIRLRMVAARRLLRETERSIIEIGLDVGYASPSHFSQVFRNHVGVSPTDYRAS